jgi:hypothetical protein
MSITLSCSADVNADVKVIVPPRSCNKVAHKLASVGASLKRGAVVNGSSFRLKEKEL